MAFTSKISKRGRGGGREEVEVKNRKMGSCSTFTPRRSSARIKTQRAMNDTEVEESSSLSASARLPPSSQAQLPFQYCYGRRGVKKTQGSNRKRTPRMVEIESLYFERNGGPTVERVETQPFEDGLPYVSCAQDAFADDEYATLRCPEDFAAKSQKGMAGALGDDDIDEVLHDASDTEVDMTTGREVPIGSAQPIQGHEGSKANSLNRVEASLDGGSVELEFLHGFYDKVTSAHEVPIPQALDRNIGSLGGSLGNSESHEGSTPSSPKRVVASLYDGDSDEVLHDEQVDATSDNEVPITGALDTMERVEEASKDEQGQGGRAHSSFPFASPLTTSHHFVAKSINITEMVDHMDDDVSDIDSVLGSEADLVSVEGYRVKPKNTEMLRAILAKHGDIGANCTLKSVMFRSVSMDNLCEIVLELKRSNILHVAKDKIKDMQTSICDLEMQNIEVGWLKARLDMVLAATNVIPILKRTSGVRMLKDQRKEKVKLLREQLNNYNRDIQSLQQKVNATIGELSRAESEAKETDLIFSESKAKMKLVVELDTLISGLI